MLSESILIIEYILAYCVSELSITNIKSLLTAIVYLCELWNSFKVLTDLQIGWVLLEIPKRIHIALVWPNIANNVFILNHPLNIWTVLGVKVCRAEKAYECENRWIADGVFEIFSNQHRLKVVRSNHQDIIHVLTLFIKELGEEVNVIEAQRFHNLLFEGLYQEGFWVMKVQ
jgi:hypothetical protein